MPYKNIERKKQYEKQYYERTKVLSDLIVATCNKCGISYTKTGKNQKYCSKTCNYNILHKKKRQDIKFKTIHGLRSRLRKLLKKGKGIKTSELIGCNSSELKQHLESKWQSGMSWDNYGIRGWHIDHIIPLSRFDLTNLEELKIACHYTNLQPLWWQDNLKKGNNIKVI